MAATAESFASVALTDFHNHPGTVIDQSQQAPVVLTKNKRRYAAVVSIDYLERATAALEALHANRRVLTSETMTDDDAARLETSLPSEAELASGRYDWQDR
ncbi:type II toxin-antitoxin system prevent-host-death family antitoxin [Sphingomonas lacusdianchii]|uniref:type II toxin-antitoxin system prevent-host-death family antitoxin n=1 Tax=Sphingomonas lacusdianchii TaxID=2917992 RepID=UPI001F59CA65|nr:type II toxin-antitoxin system prevent-host-death family antitoxin [Sphingomonas sp. JXJ CY 53]